MAEKEIQPKEGHLKETDATVKRPYVAPQLQEYGSLIDLTQGGTGSQSDGDPSASWL